MRCTLHLAACLSALGLAAPAAAQDHALGDLLAATHVHGLAFDPQAPGRVLLATHHGLWTLDLATLAVAEVRCQPSAEVGTGIGVTVTLPSAGATPNHFS